jgi:hypothetical protein
MNQKIFIGNGKTFGQYGSIGGSICLSDIPQHHIKTGKNGKQYVNININPNKNGTDKFNNTHNITINDWTPNGQNQQQAPQRPTFAQQPQQQPQSDPFGSVNTEMNDQNLGF